MDFSVELGGEFQQRRVTTRFESFSPFTLFPGDAPFGPQTRQINRWRRFDETGRISLEGDLFDPDVFAFAGQFGFGLAQEYNYERLDGVIDGRHSSGGLLEYDFRADLLRSGPLSASLFGLQTHDRYARPFLPSLRERRTEYGASVSLNHDVLPMEWRWEYRDTDRDGDRLDLDNERITQNLFQYSATWNHLPEHTGRLNVEYDDRDETYSGGAAEFHTRRWQTRYEDTLLFGPSREHRVDTVVRYQDEQGDLARDLFEAGPRLTLTHSPSLSSHYQYQYSRERVGEYDVQLNRADLGFVHQLFSNLTTTGNLFGLNETVAGDVETDELGGTLDWGYTRANPLGAFSADLGLTHEYERARGGAVRVQLRESGGFRDPLPVTLSRPGVFSPSLVVWDATRTRLFVRGRDYHVTQRGGYTFLSRSPLGRIRNGDSVSVDYVYAADADAKRSTTRVDFRAQQAFSSGWTPYYALQFRHEDRDRSLGAPRRGNDLNRHRLGVKYQQPRYSAGGELEILRDDIDPFVAYRLFGDAVLLRRAASTLDARVDLSHFVFDRDGNRDVLLLETSLDGRVNWAERSSGFARAMYRYEDDRSRGIVHGVDLESGAEIRWGPYTVTASIEYDLLNIVNSRDDGLGVWLRARRDFSGPSAEP